MDLRDMIQLAAFFGLLIGLTLLLGPFMARVFQGERTFLHPALHPVEKFIYRVCGTSPEEEMTWKRYFLAVVMFNVVGLLSLWALQMAQAWLPLNPQHYPNVPWALALNTAVSFVTNTNWQNYAGETTMSYLTQMTGLAVHNFLSAATGIAILVAFARGLKRASSKTLGNFWVDMTRTTLYILLPLSTVVAVVLASQGVVQTFKPYPNASLVESYTTQVAKMDDKGNPVTTKVPVTVSVPKLDEQGVPMTNNGVAVMFEVPKKDDRGRVMMTNVPVMTDVQVGSQAIPVGPAASQIAIKQLGTNGGGFYGQNSAHPFENPTPLSNFVELLAMVALAASLVYSFGIMAGNVGHARVLFSVMLLLLMGGFGLAWWSESQPNPVLGNVLPLMEGKEQRLGVMNSVLWAAIPARR